MRPLIDPRKGDIESDASSSQSRSLWSIAGSMLAEISLPKLIVAWFVLLGLPALLLGAMPIFASIWINATTLTLVDLSYGLVPLLLLIGLAATALLGFRRLFRLAERSFWALNSLAVQPAYALCREVLSQIAERVLPPDVTMARRAKWRAITAILSGLIICLVSIGVLLLVWPHVRLVVEFSALKDPVALVTAALANSIGIVAAYVAVAVLVWSVADATMPATGDFDGFAAPADGEPARDEQIWRVAHLSDIHVVGEKYGFRIECGRSGPRGNERLIKVLKRLDDIQAEQPLHAILVTGDITDAGLATEWAEFFDAVSQFPRVAQRMFLIPGNHDINIVNRANPAQFDLPTSPNKKLRKLRILSALNAIQGSRVRVLNRRSKRLDETLERALDPYVAGMATFADTGKPRGFYELDELWANAFPMVLPPERDDGIGIVLAELECQLAFLVHQCARDGVSRPVLGGRSRLCAISARLLDRVHPSPRHGIPAGRRGAVRAHRHGADQRPVVRPPAAAICRQDRRHARPSALRLVRPMRRVSDPVRAFGGHGRNGRCADPFLHPHDRGRSRRQAEAIAAAAGRRGWIQLGRFPPVTGLSPLIPAKAGIQSLERTGSPPSRGRAGESESTQLEML